MAKRNEDDELPAYEGGLPFKMWPSSRCYSMTSELSLINNTGTSISVVDRNGLRVDLRSETVTAGGMFPGIYVIRRLRAKSDSAVRVVCNTDAVDFTDLRIAESQKRSAVHGVQPPRGLVEDLRFDSYYELSSHYNACGFYPLGAIRGRGGRIYLRELDLMAKLGWDDPSFEHPDGVAARIVRAIEDDSPTFQGGRTPFRTTMFIVDNLGRYGCKYVNLMDKVQPIMPFRAPELEDGFYYNHPVEPVSGGVPTESITERFSVEEAMERLPIYNTLDEAKRLGGSDKVVERESLQLKREALEKERALEEDKQRFEEEKRRYELLAMDRKEKTETVKAEASISLSQMEYRRQMQNIRADERIMHHKEMMDTFKFVTTMSVSILGLFAALVKLRTGK